MQVLADATNVIAEGEVLQLLNVNDPDTDEESYLRVIRYKTAKLFEAATQVGAILGGASPALERALAEYGMHLGTAFQLIDDVLDYSGDLAETGKNLGDDLAEGKPTLPLIRAMQVGTSDGARAHPPRHRGGRQGRPRGGRGGHPPHRGARLRARLRPPRGRHRHGAARCAAGFRLQGQSATIGALFRRTEVLVRRDPTGAKAPVSASGCSLAW